ncbi:GNAT family N-acetyltransferase [Sphingomonas sp. QA11]|uniref:GNAT family N-acetyltransferase n=1 Tax=Sphingomonas sp. QA11 TaxID=2950605 RepID=UPI0023497AA4|nr:GNAT family protein [Sphingomonas sp. QA11]WCM28160.1 GNAT family N-acetyltransferase [Sphingomonas sp. QA11]
MSDSFVSERLAMRPQRLEDAEALHEGYRDEALMRYWSSAPHANLAETSDYLAKGIEDTDWRGWVITLRESGEVIGTLAAMPHREGVTEVGYLLLRRFWGHGYAREAVARLLDLLLREEGDRRVMADADPENDASNALLKDLGFTLEGRLRGEWETHIGVRDSLIWGLLAEEWKAR